MQELWNEGRVVGLSAYEQYVKQSMEINPEGTPSTEREWLASSLASGSSLLIQIQTNTGRAIPDATDPKYYILDIQLPVSCNLRAANVIYGSYFEGFGTPQTSATSATSVYQYDSLLIDNPAGLSTTTGDSYTITDPSVIRSVGETSTSITPAVLQNRKEKLLEYKKIASGVVLQAGTWTKVTTTSAPYDFSPDLSIAPLLRLRLTELLTVPVWIILTGFTCSAVVAGTTGVDTSMNTAHPADGDYLGPADYPWAAPVIFTATNTQFNAATRVTVTTSGEIRIRSV